jgi:hypothetical protein
MKNPKKGKYKIPVLKTQLPAGLTVGEAIEQLQKLDPKAQLVGPSDGCVYAIQHIYPTYVYRYTSGKTYGPSTEFLDVRNKEDAPKTAVACVFIG